MSVASQAAQPGLEPSVPDSPTFLRHFLRRPAGVVAAVFLIVLVLCCAGASLIAPYSPTAQDLTHVLSGPTSQHLLGTDELGRDVLSRLLYGGQRSLLACLEAVTVVLIVGVPLGLAAGYVGRGLDWSIMRLVDILQSIPAMVLILVALAIFPSNEMIAMVLLGVLGSPTVIRVVRSATLAVKSELYVPAARVSGLSHLRIVMRHVLPRVKGPIVVQASLFAASALLFETGLAYLGVTSNPGTASWGGMVSEAAEQMLRQSWLLVPSGVTIGLTILAFGVLGDAIGDAFAAVEGRVVTARPKRRHHGSASQHVDARPGAGQPGHQVTVADFELKQDAQALLTVRNLSVTVSDMSGSRVIVDGVSFSVTPGEAVGVVGESGCGKSVTAQAFLRLLPPTLTATGIVNVDGRETLALTDHEFDALRGSTLGYISQEPQSSLDPTFTIGSQLAEVVRRHDHSSRASSRQRMLKLLELVQLPNPEQVLRRTRMSSPAGWHNVSRSRWHWPVARDCWWPTSRRLHLT